MSEPLNAYLVCGGKYHDFDFARVELLKLLGEHEDVRTRVAEDYADLDAIAASDFLLTYTCDVRPEEEQQVALAEYVASGKRWFALHGTNSIIVHQEGFAFDCPRTYPKYVQTLGSQFIAHPPIQPFRVSVTRPDHPLTKDIEPFDATDELYLCDYHGEIEPLLETRFTGQAPGFSEVEWPNDEPRLVMYLHPVGNGSVLYLTLGHCRGKYDMRPLLPEYPQIERGAWEIPAYYELLRRGLRWSKGGLPAV